MLYRKAVFRGLSVLLLGTLLVSCTAQYTAKRSAEFYEAAGISAKTRIQRNEQWVMEPGSQIYVATPRSHKDIGDLHQHLSKNLARGLELNFARVVLGSGALGLNDALKEARANQTRYLIYPRLAATQDGINSYQEYDERFFEDGKKFGFDRLNVQLQIYNALDGQFLDQVNIESRSGWFSIYSTSPEALMASAFQQTAELLVGRGQ